MNESFEKFGDLKWSTFIYDQMIKLDHNRTKQALSAYYMAVLKS